MTPTPSAQGSLDKTPFPHLLVYVQAQKLSGTLAIWPDRSEMTGERPAQGQDRLLFAEGRLTAVRPREPAASALSALLRLFQRKDGTYGFYEQQDLLGPGPEVLRESVDIPFLLARGLREVTLEEPMQRAVARLAGRKLRLKSLDLSQLGLSASEHAVLESLRKQAFTPEELFATHAAALADVKRTLYLLALLRALELEDGNSISGRPAAPTPTPTPPAFGPTPASVAVKAKPAGLSEADAARWDELLSLHARLDDLTHFELLGVVIDASASDISAAYFARVKRFHPDRLPPALAPLGTEAQQLFDRLTEANETLGRADMRAEYTKAVEGGGGTRSTDRLMRNILESAVEFQKAEVLMKRRDYAQALTLVQSALEKNPTEPDCLALHGWLLHLMHPGEIAPFDEILRSLDASLSVHIRNDRAQYYRGIVCKRLGRNDEAIRHFRSAAEINPRHVDAVREVRLFEMRKDSKPPLGGGFEKLLSKLFGSNKG